MALEMATKKLFADGLLKLAQDKPVAKIGVAELCRSCGASRQTFYHHFHDKYDLVAWIYLQDLSEAAGPEGDIGRESLARMLEAVRAKGGFYRNALQDASQNNLLAYIVDYGTGFMLGSLARNRGLEPTRELRMAVRYHSYGMVGLTFDWLGGACDTDADELAGLLSGSIERMIGGIAEAHPAG